MTLRPNDADRPRAAACRWFPGSASSVRDVRRFIANRLQDCPATDDAILVASELATNAIQHTESGNWTTGFLVMLEHTTDEGALITVQDAGSTTHTPYLADSTPDTEHGRGLNLVNTIAKSWGSQGSPAERMTWCAVQCH
ncbi:anti-sigma regulatory factor (Ser/Thr protein kinase) [Lipingzhangella halophila]|uniref:Anti-sigma regulatory factor (Ser/Thr protein kinase) n=1 Tax=Lipingzhangella halophila TaxID=1783352 RepID=A0A7W7RJP2_9ACTN|nr:ATP-binding protein [Lipingzhangella halophila]MBB4933227.1 anti-sigma regulatory factor (Ser/Thr protein kinase) [Lipingzhangella halophila]